MKNLKKTFPLKSIFANLLILYFLLFANSCALTRVHHLEVNEISEVIVLLKANQKVVFKTGNLSEGSDPVLHLLNPITGEELAVNDNGGGNRNALLTYTPSKSGKYNLLIRSKSNNTHGFCSLLKDNSILKTHVPFGGNHLKLGAMSKNEIIHFIKAPKGPNLHIVLILKNKKNIEKVIKGDYVSHYTIDEKVGSKWMIIGKILTGDEKFPDHGSMRVYVNDKNLSNSDNDSDGIGNRLEKSIGTCSTLNGYVKGKDGEEFDCSLASDARDTDGDGISDGFELLGKKSIEISKSLYLPTWGADPRHKDLFLEVDFTRRSKTENDNSISLKMYPHVARHFAKIYADNFETEPFFKLYNATIMKNPDRKPGLNIHLDIGLEPELESDLTIFGDWKGYTAVNAVQDKDGNWEGQKPNDAWKTEMAANRIGIFRYTLGYSGGGGACGVGAFACGFNFHNLTSGAHELGHTLGLGHSGPFGYAGPNCAPNYPSIMNYAYLDKTNIGFSSRPKAFGLNNAMLTEWQAISPNAKFFPFLNSIFKYYVDPIQGHVDWNRDGVFAPQGTKVKAYANYTTFGGGCEYTRVNQVKIPLGFSTISPAITRLKNRLYIFYKITNTIGYVYSSSNWNCPQPNHANCQNGTWSARKTNSLSTVGGIDAIRFGTDQNPSILVVTNGINNILQYNTLTVNSFGIENWGIPKRFPKLSKSEGEPSLAYMNSNLIYLAYKATDHSLRLRKYQNIGGVWQWAAEEVARDSVGNTLFLNTESSPSIINATLSWNAGTPTLYGAFAMGSNSTLYLWAYNSSLGYWERTHLIENTPSDVKRRPAMAWVPSPNNPSLYGRLYLLCLTGTHSDKLVVKMMHSYIKVTSNNGQVSKVEKVGLRAYFDNAWYFSKGMDLLYDRNGLDTNLRYVGSFSKNDGNQLFFRPNADAIVDFQYIRQNDWETITKFVCKGVVNPDGMVINPIKCIDN